jgi:hypothetical protein
LKKFKLQAESLKRDVAATMSKTARDADDIVVERRRQLSIAVRELELCEAQKDSNCSGYRRRADLCRRALEDAIRGRALIEGAVVKFRQAQARHSVTVEQTLTDGQKLVSKAAERVEKYVSSESVIAPAGTGLTYRAGGGVHVSSGGSPESFSTGVDIFKGSGGGGQSVGEAATRGWRDFQGVSVPDSYPRGFASVPISAIIDSNPVVSEADFDAGQSVSNLRWAVDALFEVVMPAMAAVSEPQQYLRDRDISENLSGSRSYCATYEGFFGDSTPIKLSPGPNETFEMNNGSHRLWLAKASGATHIPARIRE